MTVKEPHEQLKRRTLEERAALMAEGVKRGLESHEVFMLSLMDQVLGFPEFGNAEYDQYNTKIDMFRAYLKKAGAPTPMGKVCDEIAAANSRYDRRGLWSGGLDSINKEYLVNISGFGKNRVIGLPEWQQVPFRKK